MYLSTWSCVVMTGISGAYLSIYLSIYLALCGDDWNFRSLSIYVSIYLALCGDDWNFRAYLCIYLPGVVW